MRVLIVTALITALIGGLCVGGALVLVDRGELEGSGAVVSEERPVAGIDRVEIDGPGLLVVSQGAEEGLRITTDDNILETIETEVDDGSLEITYERSGLTTLSRIRPTDEIRFELTVPALTAIEVNGTADVEIDGFQGDRLQIDVNGLGDAALTGLRLDELDVSISGAGTFDVAGAADRQAIEIDGSGDYRAANLASREAAIEIDGDGDATLRVSDALQVEIDGRGTVEYIGSPSITQDISGSGELRQLEEGATPAAEGTPLATPAATPGAAQTVTTQPTPRSVSPTRATPTSTPDD